MRAWLDAARTALAFLTVLPVPGGPRGGDEARRRASALFPVVGLLIGLLVALTLLLPVPPLARAALALLVWTAITGGLHEDGWADCMDAAFAHVSRERRIEILADPRVGAHGVTGTAVLLLARFAALASVSPGSALAAPVLGRWAMAVSLSLAPPLRATGLGTRWAAGAGPLGPTGVTVVLLAGLAAASTSPALSGSLPNGPSLILATATAATVSLAGGRFLVGRFGGLSGDGHGSVGLLAETAALFAFLPVAGG